MASEPFGEVPAFAVRALEIQWRPGGAQAELQKPGIARFQIRGRVAVPVNQNGLTRANLIIALLHAETKASVLFVKFRHRVDLALKTDNASGKPWFQTLSQPLRHVVRVPCGCSQKEQ